MIKIKYLKIISLIYYSNDNLITYKDKYNEISQIAKMITLNSIYTSPTIQNEIINILQYILNENIIKYINT